MTLNEIDPNTAVTTDIPEDTEWYPVPDEKHFSLHGVFYDAAAGCFLRMPEAVAKEVSSGVEGLNHHSSGGRIAFVTDSDTISLYASVHVMNLMSMMSWSGQSCFDLYVDGKFHGLYRSAPGIDAVCTATLPKGGLIRLPKGKKHLVLNFPAYAEVRSLAVGIQKGAVLQAENPYKDIPPVLYYGSSITQGAACSRPGLMYQNYLAREFRADYVNLGFSGNAKGEQTMIDYLATIPSSLFVMDFDHNLNHADKLVKAHYPLYKAYRAAHPDTPILFISRPSFDYCLCSVETREVILQSLAKAKAEGDRNVYFLDGETIYGEVDRDACTVDGTHPTDIGFYRFYQALRPFFKKLGFRN